jgi:membrane peptidoglycan carboxypeptidase
MPSVPQIIGFRGKREKRARSRIANRAALPAGAFISLAAAISFILFYSFYIQLVQGLPSLWAVRSLVEPPDGLYLHPTRLYDRTGEHLILTLENPAAEGRRYLYYPYPSSKTGRDAEQAISSSSDPTIPRSLILATIAGRDPGLWKHSGFLLEGVRSGAHPTIAQQLAVDLLLVEEPPGLSRSLRERLYAGQITAQFGREKILEWYLNSAHYGQWIYGIDAAARVYFGKPAERLTLAEAAFLTAVSEAPNVNPLVNPEPAFARQKEIIGAMVDQGLISEAEAKAAASEKIVFQLRVEPGQEITSSYIRLVIEQVSKQVNPSAMERGGLNIITTLDFDLQNQIHCLLEHQISRMQEYRESPGEPAEETNCSSSPLLPIQSFLPENSSLDLVGSAIVLDHKTGQILALTGSGTAGFDPARPPGKPPGSLLTPFIYLTAFSRGFSPASLVWDIPESLPESIEFEGEQYHGPMRLRTAFANDFLIPSIQILEKVGPESVWSTLNQLGVSSLTLPAVQGFLTGVPLLSGGETTLLEISRAFGVIANQGLIAGIFDRPPSASGIPQQIQPVTVLQVMDSRGRILLDCLEDYISCHQVVRPVISPELSYLVTEVMSDEPARRPSLGHPNPLEIGRPAAAKIGSTNSSYSAWTVGFTPHLTAAVWLGNGAREPVQDTWSSLEDNSLTSGAAGLWHAIMQVANLNLPPDNWNEPPGIIQIDVCDPSGLLPTIHCPSVVREVFVQGNEPTHPDTLYKAFQVNRETGRLATVYTPPGMVEEKVYFVVPPEGAGWSQVENLPRPPDVYDAIVLPPQSNPEAVITSPPSFSHVNGMISIIGSAAGQNFAFYRLQVGKGLNPREWFQVGEDQTQPVRNKLLGEWDATGESGLYVIQLLVVDNDQRVENSIVQVTIDNNPPGLKIIQPTQGQVLKSGSRTSVVIQAQAEDDVSLSTVEFYIDGIRLVTFNEPPFVLSWKSQKGEYTLKAKAVDQAGNYVEETVTFTVE